MKGEKNLLVGMIQSSVCRQ